MCVSDALSDSVRSIFYFVFLKSVWRDSMKDSEYMELALMLAKNGLGWTAPNPMVGAVLVKDGEIIGQGWHEKCGEPHAERNALANCKKSPQGATLYVTLEPCCHQGRQPPCLLYTSPSPRDCS